MRISRQPFPAQIMIDQTQLEKVEYFNYLDSIIPNDARCNVTLNTGLPWQKAAINKETLQQQSGLKFTENNSEELEFEHRTIGC